MTTRFEKLTFPGSQGASLAGRLELPDGEPRAFFSSTERLAIAFSNSVNWPALPR